MNYGYIACYAFILLDVIMSKSAIIIAILMAITCVAFGGANDPCDEPGCFGVLSDERATRAASVGDALPDSTTKAACLSRSIASIR